MKMKKLKSPEKIKEIYSTSDEVMRKVSSYRRTVRQILDFKDSRFLIILGPCSLHDPGACLEYAEKLKSLADEVSERIFIVMRVYPEKPRSQFAWKGYLTDPRLDGTSNVQEGIISTRKTMLAINALGLPVASEILNPAGYLYFQDQLSWCAVGARTVGSQPHREIAANLNFPVGFKNSISGNVEIAVNAIAFSNAQQSFLGVNEGGHVDLVRARGNPYSHLVLRGSENGGNYSKTNIQEAEELLASVNLPANIIVDCSHGNSAKNHIKQASVLDNLLLQKSEGSQSIVGAMLESFLVPGKQPISADANKLRYGCSITDSCIGWEETQQIVRKAYQQLVYLDSCLKKEKRWAIFA